MGNRGSLSFRQIYSKVFGPTYPGWFDPDTCRYVLSYPGVAFSFNLPDSFETSTSEGIIKRLTNKDAPGSCAKARRHQARMKLDQGVWGILLTCK